MFDTSTRPGTAADELVGEMIRYSGARPSDNVLLAGSDIGLLVELCRRGFAHACLAAAPGPRGAEQADVLWLPHVSTEALAGGRLHGFVHGLRDGGTVVLQGDAPASRDVVAALRRLLQAEGCQAVGQMVRASSFCLFARKPGRREHAALAA
jgi:hypothetical protein